MSFLLLSAGGTSRQCIIGSDEEECYNMTVTRWRDTGDYGKVTKDGLIYYIGREDTQIKRQGKRLNLEEINQVLTLVLLNLYIPCLCKHCKSTSVGF